MSRVNIVGQRPLKETDAPAKLHLRFFSNKDNPNNDNRPTWYSGMPDDFVEEPIKDTLRWMENEGFNVFCLQLIYD